MNAKLKYLMDPRESMIIKPCIRDSRVVFYKLNTASFSCTRRTLDEAIVKAKQDLNAGYIKGYSVI